MLDTIKIALANGSIFSSIGGAYKQINANKSPKTEKIITRLLVKLKDVKILNEKI